MAQVDGRDIDISKAKGWGLKLFDMQVVHYAAQLDETVAPYAMGVRNRDGTSEIVHGEVGDWVLFYAGSRYLIPDRTFRLLFEPIDDAPEVPYGLNGVW